MSVVILGSGIGGLSVAHYLLRLTPCSVKLIDGSNRVGGWIRSHRLDNGLVFEQGPRTLKVDENGLNTLNLIEDLNMSAKIRPITADHPAVKNRFIYLNQKLHPLRTDLINTLRTIPPFSEPLINAVYRDLCNYSEKYEDDTIYNFTERRFGKEIADYVFSSIICGICAGDAKKISVNLLLGSWFEKEQKYGSVLKGVFRDLFRGRKTSKIVGGHLATVAKLKKWILFSIEGGTECLSETLHSSIQQKGGEVLLNSFCKEISLVNKSVTLSSGQKLHFDHLISSIPASELAPLLKKEHPCLADNLEQIPYVTVATVNLAYSGQWLNEPGFGFLVPPIAKNPLLGVTYDSCYSETKDFTVLTAMIGGYNFEKYCGQFSKEEEFLDVATTHVARILNIPVEPVDYKVSILRNCIPQYIVGHKKRVENMFQYINNRNLPLSLIGNSYNGIGLNDVILNAKIAVEKFGKQLNDRNVFRLT